MWASSIFAPWVTSTDPKLWLYDILFYARFILLFWGVLELLYAWQQLRNKSVLRKPAIASTAVVGIAALIVSAYVYLMHTGNGFRIRVDMSVGKLRALQKPDFADRRQRAGWFLIDTQRRPCDDQSWLWLGQPHGGGTGTNLALVYSKNAVPKTPIIEAFRFWRVSDHWWLAYQNPQSYNAHINDVAVCIEGKIVETHDQGMEFINAPAAN